MSKNNNNKLSPEKLKQLQQLQQMMAMQLQQKGGKMPAGMPGAIDGPKQSRFKIVLAALNPRRWPYAILGGMQGSVKFIDQFINFVAKKDSGKVNDLVTSARSPILFGTYIIVFFVLFGGLWAATAPLDSATVAIGTVISNSKKKEINHQDDGVIKEIFVKVGDEVKKGDDLMSFDDISLKSQFKNSFNQYVSMQASEDRVSAEINGNEEITFSEFLIENLDNIQVKNIVKTQKRLFQSKRKFKQAEQDSIDQKIKQLNKKIESGKAQILSLDKTLELGRDRIVALKKLVNQGLAQKRELLMQEQSEADTVIRITQTDADIANSEQEIIRSELERINLENKITNENLRELREVQAKLIEAQSQYYIYKDRLSRVVIKSPVDGVINNINFFTIGSVVPRGQTIFEISPSKDMLVIEARIEPKDIDSMKAGLLSKMRFSAFKSRTTPLFKGKVISISPDIIIEQKYMNHPQYANGYYLAKIEIDMEQFQEVAKKRNLQLQPGMQAEVSIVKGTRTLLQYLLDPLLDAMFKGMKEK